MAVFLYKNVEKDVVKNMLKNVEILIALVLLLIAVMCIYNARWIVKNRFKMFNENRAVDVIKITGYVVSVLALLFIYLKH